LLVEVTLGVLCCNQSLKTEEENDYRDDEQREDESTHDDDPYAHALASADERDGNV
jgi:hypothetical protein